MGKPTGNKKKSYLSDEDILKLKEILSKDSFYEEFNKECEANAKEIDEMTKIDISILREPMTI